MARAISLSVTWQTSSVYAFATKNALPPTVGTCETHTHKETFFSSRKKVMVFE